MNSTLRSSLRWAALFALGLGLAAGPQQTLAQRALGVDVSDHQGTGASITWSSVKSAGYSFAWSKATEGTGYTATSFAPNEVNGKAAGVYIGAYDFARPDLVSPTAEAAYFWSVAGSYIKADGMSLQPMLDYETFQGLVGASTYADWANQWCNAIVAYGAAAGVKLKPVIYTTTCEACDLNSSVAQWTPWIANPSGENGETGNPWDYTSCDSCDWWGGWSVWQYSWGGYVSGIPTVVDLDAYNGSSISPLLVHASHPAIDTYEGNDGNGNMQIYLPDAVNNVESDWQSTANGNWVGWSSFGGLTAAGIPAVGYNADGRMQVFVRDSTGAVWSIWKTALNGGWSAWTSFGGNVVGNITVGYLPDGSMQVFGRSPSNTVTTMNQTSANGGWSSWSDMGGSCYGDPVAGANADGRLEVFCRTVSNTMQTIFKTSTSVSASWSSWYDFGGSVYGKLAVGNLGDGTMQLFARSGTNTVQTIWQNGPNGALGSWSDMGGSCYSDPVLAYSSDGSFRLFIRTSSNTVAVNAKADNQSGGWGGWTDLGGNCAGYLAAGYNADTRIQFFMRDSNYNVQSLWQTSVNGGWSSWLNMGGATPAVSIATQPANQVVLAGQNASFSVAANNALTYQWQFNGTNLAGATTSTCTINNAQTTNAGTYTVVAGNNAGSVTSSSAVLTVSDGVPPSITTQPVSQSATQGQSAVFSVVAAGSAPLAYQWQFNGTNLAGATATSCTVSNAQSSNAGSYSVVVTNIVGSVTSTNAVLTVIVPSPITTPPASQMTCQGSSVTFCVTASATPSTYQWQFNGNNISSSSSCYQLGNVHTNKTGNYTVVVSNYHGIATSAVATLTVLLPLAIATQPQSQVVTQGGGGTFSVTAAAGTSPAYQWQFNGANVAAALSSCSLDNVQPPSAGGYTVALTNACGSLTSSVAWLTVVAPPASQTATQGAGVTFTVTNYGADPSLTWQWQQNGTNLTDGGRVSGSATTNLSLSNLSTNDAGSYTVVVSNSAASSASAGASLTVLAAPYIITPPQSLTITQGGNAVFSVAAGGTAPLSYQWQKNGANISGATTTALTLSNATTNNAATYTVIVGNGVGSPASASASLTVLTPQWTRFDSISLQPDGSVQLGISGTPGLSYTLLCTSNWVDWLNLTSFTGSDALFLYNDPGVTNAAQRFYRVRCP
jgi:GH25 family lysozyme M1 (1,4-beta-N-acetylmuramidase)